MEQRMGKFIVGQQKNSEQISHNSFDNRNEGVGSVNPRFTQDPSNSMNMNLRPSDSNMAVGARPVLNYSIQTGEEFALEFMWERVNPRQQYIPDPSLEANNETASVNLHGVLGASVEKGKVQDPVTNVSLRDEKPIGKPLQSKSSSVHTLRSHSSLGSSGGGSSRTLKLLCSFGGKVMPRPSDQKLRYVGGETRILRISKHISWEELKQKMTMLYNEPHSIKYQLPGEDLDALVTVSSDEDLQNMMEECNALVVGESQKLRLFLISNNDLDDSQLRLESIEGDSEIQYVVAVNGMDFGSRRNSIGVGSHLGNNLDGLLGLSVGKETSRIAAGGTAHPEVVLPSTNQSSQTVHPSSSQAFQANSLSYQVHQTVNHEQHESSRAFHEMGVHPNAYDRIRYNHSSRQSNNATVAANSVPNPILGHVVPPEAPNMAQPYGSLNTKELGVLELTTKVDKVGFEYDKDQPSQTGMDTQMNKESSVQKISDSIKVQSLDDGKTLSSQPYDASSAVSDATHKGTSMKISERKHEDVRNYVPPNIIQDQTVNKFDTDDHSYTSSAPVGPVRPIQSDSELHAKDISYEQDMFPQPLFRSERIHREQSGLNRLFNSDDSSGPQLRMTHSRSDVSQQIKESADKSTDWNVTANSEKVNAFTKSTLMDEEKARESQSLPDIELNAAVAPTSLTSRSNVPITNQGTSEYSQYESSATPTEIHQNKLLEKANNEKLHVMDREDIPSAAASQRKSRFGAGAPEHGDILIDINDRFPNDLLSDIFSMARTEESSTGTTPLQGDVAGLSVNMINHEPKHWSFFQNLAKDDRRKDVSLMDQDHLAFSSSRPKIGEDAPVDYGYSSIEAGAIAADRVDSSSNFGANNQRQSSGPVRPDTMNLPSDYDVSQTTGIQTAQLDRPMNSKTAESDHEVLFCYK